MPFPPPLHQLLQVLDTVRPGASRFVSGWQGADERRPAGAFSLAALIRYVPLVQALDTVWLGTSSFVAGQEEVSLADLLMACEVEMLRLLDAADQVRI